MSNLVVKSMIEYYPSGNLGWCCFSFSCNLLSNLVQFNILNTGLFMTSSGMYTHVLKTDILDARMICRCAPRLSEGYKNDTNLLATHMNHHILIVQSVLPKNLGQNTIQSGEIKGMKICHFYCMDLLPLLILESWRVVEEFVFS